MFLGLGSSGKTGKRSLCVSRDVSEIVDITDSETRFALREQGCFQEIKRIISRQRVRSA